MFTPNSMELVGIVILKEKMEDFTSILLKSSIFHPVDIRMFEKDFYLAKRPEIEKELIELEELELNLNNLVRHLNVSLEIKKELKTFDILKIRKIIDEISQELNPLINKHQELQENLKAKELAFVNLKKYLPFPIKLDKDLKFLNIFFGKIKEIDADMLIEKLKGLSYIFKPLKKEDGDLKFILISLKRDSQFIKKVLQDISSYRYLEFLPEDEDTYKDLENTINLEIKKIEEEIKSISKNILFLSKKNSELLSDIYTFIRVRRSVILAKDYFYTTEKTAIIFGWVPEEERVKLISILKGLHCAFYIEEKTPKELDIPKGDIPVKIRHNKFIKPFELLVKSFGLPRYGTIDPTIFVAISFLIMFGAMFGDLGQGLLLILIGIFMFRSKEDKLKDTSILFIYCGISSSIFGFLYGSFFGFEYITPSIIKPMKDIFGVFKLSILFGVIIISLGILLNVLNALRDRDYIKMIFDKAGLIVGIIYWLILGLLVKLFVKNYKIDIGYIILIFICFLLLFLKPIIEVVFNRHKKENIFIMFLESFIEILEVFIGYFANTISFIRISAFSLAHIGLFLAIFELSKIIRGSGLSILVIIFGNIFIMLLEGVVVAIQSLRLNYYEFFSKFFIQAKECYKPLRIEK